MPEWSPVIGSKGDIRARIQGENPPRGQQVWADLDRYPWEAPEHQQLEWLSQNPVITDFLLNRPSSAPQNAPQQSAPAPTVRSSPSYRSAAGPAPAPSPSWGEVRAPLEDALRGKGYTAPQQPAAAPPPTQAPPSPWLSARTSVAQQPAAQGPQDAWAPSLWRWLSRYYENKPQYSRGGGGGTADRVMY